ncbi:MAG: hypothetical protein WCR07_08080 [Verrucomicrobiota bacterium]|jgi:hypothetical protein
MKALMRRGAAALVLALGAGTALIAFPPTPHHVLRGLVRDEQGNPLVANNATVILESGGAVVSSALIRTASSMDGNYRMVIPMDSGSTDAAYAPKAMFPAVPFRLKVKIGAQTFVPIEMSGTASLMTRPAGRAQVDLTLGLDSDADGLPDAWERTLLAALRKKGTLADIKPGADDDGDGITNLSEYLAGTYAFDPSDGFAVEMKAMELGLPVLEFLAIQGRTYSVEGSDDLKAWRKMSFALSGEKAGTEVRDAFSATEVAPTRVRVAASPSGETARFFRVMVR